MNRPGVNDEGEAQVSIGTETSVLAKRATAGDPESLSWLVERFSPLLLQQVGYRLPRALRSLVSPDDIVQDVWATVLPRLGEIEPGEPGLSRAILRYLSTSVVNRVNELSRKQARALATNAAFESPTLSVLPAVTAGIVTRAASGETARFLHKVIGELPETSREVLILRGIEQRSLAEIARRTGCSENVISQRFARAVERLRTRVSADLIEDLLT